MPQKGGIANETIHLSFAADWSKEVNPLLIVAKGISAAVARPMVIEDRTILAQVSIGISIFPKNAKNLDSLIEEADKNMYAIKRGANSSYMTSPLYRCSPMLKAHSRLIPKNDRLLPLDTRASKVVRAMEVR